MKSRLNGELAITEYDTIFLKNELNQRQKKNKRQGGYKAFFFL
jgi:hypothetical protein